MKVIAAPGLKVPTEHNPREYITADAPVEIEVTAYYLRRMADDELIEVSDAPAAPAASAVVEAKPAKATK